MTDCLCPNAVIRLILLLGLLGLNLLSFSQPALGARSALLVVEQTSRDLLSALDAQREQARRDPRRLYATVRETVGPHIDFARMSRWVLGKYWRDASAAQRARFVDQFRALLIRTYTTALLEYDGQAINYLPQRDAPDAEEVTVRTEIKPTTGLPIPVHYRMALTDGSWKVYDISIDGVSLVTNYRSTFASEIRRGGGLDGLITKLSVRNQAP